MSLKPLMATQLGVNVFRADTSQKYALGTRVIAEDGSEYEYVKNANATCAHGLAFTKAVETSVATKVADNGAIDGFNTTGTTLAANAYFWMLIKGKVADADGAAAITKEDFLVGGGAGKVKTCSVVDAAGVGILAKCRRVRAMETTAVAGVLDVYVDG